MYLSVFGCSGSSLLCEGFLQLLCVGFSLQRLLQLWSMDFRVCRLWSYRAWAQLPHGMWDLPRLGIEPMSVELAAGFFSFFFFFCSSVVYWTNKSLPLTDVHSFLNNMDDNSHSQSCQYLNVTMRFYTHEGILNCKSYR